MAACRLKEEAWWFHSKTLLPTCTCLPPLVLKARHLSASVFCNFYRLGVPEQALGGIPLSFGIVVEDKHSEFSCPTMYLKVLFCSIQRKFEMFQSQDLGLFFNLVS